jgi:alcohol dehydrogenase (cytochrome c)
VNPDKIFTAPGQEKLICPSTSGGKNYPAGTYSPLTGVMFYPLNNTCMSATSGDVVVDTDVTYALRNKVQIAPDTDKVGVIEAINVQTGATVWKREQRAGQLSLVSTAGGLLFGGDANGRFRATTSARVTCSGRSTSARRQRLSRHVRRGRQAVCRRQHGRLGLALGFVSLTPELKPGLRNQLYVFALP